MDISNEQDPKVIAAMAIGSDFTIEEGMSRIKFVQSVANLSFCD